MMGSWKKPAGPLVPAVIGMAAAAAILFGSFALAQSKPAPRTFTQDDLRKAEAARDAALARVRKLEAATASASRDLSAIDTDLLAAAADATAREEAAYAAEEQLMLLADEQQTAMATIASDRAAMEDLLAALMTFGARTPPALAVKPDDVSGAVRAAILMSEAAPALKTRADDLRKRIAAINNIAANTRAQQEYLASATGALDARREEISALAEEKRRAQAGLAAETAAARAQAQKLANEADTLRDLLASLAKAAPPRPSLKPGQKAAPARPAGSTAPKPAARPPATVAVKPSSGAPLSPVVGAAVTRFGRTVNGVKQEGMTLSARAGATVVAPLDARVQFSGPFRTYGQMVILDVGGDVLVVVSGMDALYPEAGQWVLAGEPIGRMADRKSPSPELYLEVRRKGQPVNPEIWLGKTRS